MKVIRRTEMLQIKTVLFGDPASGLKEEIPIKSLLYLKKKITCIRYSEKYNNYILIQSCSNSTCQSWPSTVYLSPKTCMLMSQALVWLRSDCWTTWSYGWWPSTWSKIHTQLTVSPFLPKVLHLRAQPTTHCVILYYLLQKSFHM